MFRKAKYNNLIMGETMPQEDIMCHQVKLGAIGQRYSMNPQSSQVIAKDIDYPSQPDGKALLMRKIITWVTKHGEMETVLN